MFRSLHARALCSLIVAVPVLYVASTGAPLRGSLAQTANIEHAPQAMVDAGGHLTLLRDRYGKLWVGTRNHALRFIPASGVYGVEDQNAGSPAETVLDFSIQPMFYQTRWFFALVATLVIGGVWTAWALHVRRIRTTFALLTAERMRLSREVHDTLLQGLVGLSLQCDAMANDPEFASPARRDQCLKLRKRIDAYVREARSSICDLRSTAQGSRDLGTALSTSAEQITTGSAIEVVCQVRGTPARYSPVVEQQVLRIGREAITNVVRHAHAATLRLELEYRSQSVILRVADDGVGFDPELVNRSCADHYGLTGIRERTENLNGWLTITASPGRGTALEVTVPVRASDSSGSSIWRRIFTLRPVGRRPRARCLPAGFSRP